MRRLLRTPPRTCRSTARTSTCDRGQLSPVGSDKKRERGNARVGAMNQAVGDKARTRSLVRQTPVGWMDG
eukprot:358605-Chlamydomonas_euryale.AAC.3